MAELAAFIDTSDAALAPEPAKLSSTADRGYNPRRPLDTPMFGRLPSDLRQREALMDLKKGSKVDFYSISQKSWIPATVLFVDPTTLAVRLDAKPTELLGIQEQLLRLRPGADQREQNSPEAQLQRVRAALGEGVRLQEEAHSIFTRYAQLVPAVGSPPGCGDDQPSETCLPPEVLEALGAELDSRLGVSGSRAALLRHADEDRGECLAERSFAQAFHELVWGRPQVTCCSHGSDLAGALTAASAKPEAEAAAVSGDSVVKSGAVQTGFLEQLRGIVSSAWEAVFQAPASRGGGVEPAEEDLRQLAEMGFEDRERCVAVLRRHGGRLTPLALEEIFAVQEASSTSSKDPAPRSEDVPKP